MIDYLTVPIIWKELPPAEFLNVIEHDVRTNLEDEIGDDIDDPGNLCFHHVFLAVGKDQMYGPSVLVSGGDDCFYCSYSATTDWVPLQSVKDN